MGGHPWKGIDKVFGDWIFAGAPTPDAYFALSFSGARVGERIRTSSRPLPCCGDKRGAFFSGAKPRGGSSVAQVSWDPAIRVLSIGGRDLGRGSERTGCRFHEGLHGVVPCEVPGLMFLSLVPDGGRWR